MSIKPDKMIRIRIIGSNLRRDQVIGALHDAGVVQLESVSPDVSKMLGTSKPGGLYKTVNGLLQKFRGYENLLPPSPVQSVRTFDSLSQLIREASSIDIEGHLKTLKDQETDLLASVKEIDSRLEVVRALMGLDYDLSIFSGSAILSYLVEEAKAEDISDALQTRIPEAVVIRLKSGSVVVTIPVGKDSDLARIANETGFKIVHIPEMTGTPEKYYEYLQSKKQDSLESVSRIRGDLSHLSMDYYESIAQIREQLEIENKKLEVAEKLAATQDTFVMEGWMPEKFLRSATELVNRVSEGKVIISQVETTEDPPTLLDNPKKFRIFEFFIRFYSLPQEYEFDPTIIFGVIFPMFFGIMVGDWGYGLIILAFSIWMIRKLENPHSKTILPKQLTGFALTLFGRGPLIILGKTLIPASLVAVAAGLLFNNFFGFPILPITVLETSTGFGGAHIGAFPPTPTVIFSSTFTIPKLLLFTGYVGLATVSFGLVMGLINEAYRHHRKGAIAKVGWLMISWGVAIFGLELIHHGRGLFSGLTANPSAMIALGSLIGGVLVVAIAEGTKGAVEIPSIISHILSYTRIMGILLASVVLAQVVDLIFMKGVMKSPVFAVIGVLILILGQLFNLVIAVFEPGIQGARLLYVEFFSKFYYGNGKMFRPFRTQRKYTNPKFVLESNKK